VAAAADGDDRLITWKLAPSRGEVRERDVQRPGDPPRLPLDRLAHVEHDHLAALELRCRAQRLNLVRALEESHWPP
jgi:hypothetical protein